MPSSAAAWAMRTAISPRLAMSSVCSVLGGMHLERHVVPLQAGVVGGQRARGPEVVCEVALDRSGREALGEVLLTGELLGCQAVVGVREAGMRAARDRHQERRP